ncbi:hypothetical protein [Streptomyces sp. WAC 06783]|uniref:ATP-dependent DNA ligase n=1 Tax=Streptomyces sp. WAC 06783 TaxID=2203211 RepID=UPI00163BCD08
MPSVTRDSANPRVSAFDLLRRAGEDLVGLSYERRRSRLEALFAEWSLAPPWTLCPMTRDRQEAMRWMRQWAAAGIEGVVVKNLRQPCKPRVRGWSEVRTRHTTEAIFPARPCVPDSGDVLTGSGCHRLPAGGKCATRLRQAASDGSGRL